MPEQLFRKRVTTVRIGRCEGHSEAPDRIVFARRGQLDQPEDQNGVLGGELADGSMQLTMLDVAGGLDDPADAPEHPEMDRLAVGFFVERRVLFGDPGIDCPELT